MVTASEYRRQLRKRLSLFKLRYVAIVCVIGLIIAIMDVAEARRGFGSIFRKASSAASQASNIGSRSKHHTGYVSTGGYSRRNEGCSISSSYENFMIILLAWVVSIFCSYVT